ncbi:MULTISPECIES: hypothetical protein [unclassified Pseudoalteromonas]|uniref:hypothetical protein n=1 Tax=unclassified Pseudoalteromonas TaxID=194690 RepID=UPI0005AA485E
MVKKLNVTVGQISGAIIGVSSSSEQLSTVTEQSSLGEKEQKISNLALGVYEQESNLFFKDMSDKIIDDDIFQRLLTFPNVLITGHQGFFTEQAMQEIVQTTLINISQFNQGDILTNQVVNS